ncbi:MAG TPA: trypsin-like peptidase domain-containing protein [Gemmatimonadaceae bacterium]
MSSSSGWMGARRRTALLLAMAAFVSACTADSKEPARAQTVTQQAAQSGTLAAVARRVTPAVVSIESEFSPEVAAQMQSQEQGIPPEMIPPQMRPQGPARATGSGFLVSSDGYILTNNHVVANAEKVNVTLLDRRIFPAKVVGHDPGTDVALIKIDGSGFPTAPLGADSSVQVGDPVLAIGNPLGLDFTVTSGIVSAKERSGNLRALFQSDYAVVDFIQTDAVINPGNSGGPLVDMNGSVIGINSAIASPTGVYAGYGFAIPISIARTVMEEIRKYGHVRRAILGVSIQDVGPADAQAAGMKEIRGALVGGYSGNDSPAKQAGLQPGDIILAVNGKPIDRVSTLQRLLLGYQPGETITVDVMRFGQKHTAKVKLGEAPTSQETRVAGGPSSGENAPGGRLGIQVTPVTPEVAGELGLPTGMTGIAVVAVDPAGPSRGLLFPRDIITATLGGGQQHPVRAVNDLRSALQSRTGVASLLVYSPQAKGTRVVNVPLER